ncbi:hypothetical protein ACFQPA_21210 [Halomarina halobia]|uniref:Uncharacterized protein n=1 Tax=Halomarina halobia TaxID=3033386 RepID=A0ABD6AFB0_9EURY|nr:hypothetical protein [Halomarina sp. PSR21]
MAQHVAENAGRPADAEGTMGGPMDPALEFASAADPVDAPPDGRRRWTSAHTLARDDAVHLDALAARSAAGAHVVERMARTLRHVRPSELVDVGLVECRSGVAAVTPPLGRSTARTER